MPSYKQHVVMYGTPYDVYTHSYLCYGANEAMRRLKAYLVKVTLQDLYILVITLVYDLTRF